MRAWQSSALTRRAFLKSSLMLPLAAASRTSSARSLYSDALPDLRGVPGYIHNGMRQLNVPGMAVSIVHQGRTLFCRGFGVKNLATGEPVDEHTLFSLASQTKPFTGTCFAILETEGRLQSQRPVLDYVPNFRLSSLEVTRQMRVSELLSHLSGLPAHAGDQLFFPPTDYSLLEVVERIHALPLVRPFRSAFAYENVLYAVAALLIERVSGMPYEQFVSSRIFRPLGMCSSAPNANEIRPGSNVATGYARRDGTRRAIPPLVWVNDPGAGGIYSSAFDMTHWMRMHLQGGVYRSAPGGGRAIVQRAGAAAHVDAADQHPAGRRR
jgi:CubicO group peptidase (beta-lactamase class C family)